MSGGGLRNEGCFRAVRRRTFSGFQTLRNVITSLLKAGDPARKGLGFRV